MTPTFDPLAMFRQLDPGQVFLQRGMRARLADEQEMPVHRPHGLTHRLARIQVVAEVDRGQIGATLAVGIEPAPDRHGLAVLLVMAVLRHHELRRQGQHLMVPGRHQGGGQKRMEILDIVAAPTGRAVAAVQLLGAEVFGAVEGDQHMSVQPAKRLQPARALQLRQRGGEQRMKMPRIDRVQHRPNVVVARDRGHAEQGFTVRSPLPLGQVPLMREKRRALHEEQRKRRQPDVGHAVAAVRTLPFVRQRGTTMSKRCDQAVQRLHADFESENRERGNPYFQTRSRSHQRSIDKHLM